jgi:hypothetical protein
MHPRVRIVPLSFAAILAATVHCGSTSSGPKVDASTAGPDASRHDSGKGAGPRHDSGTDPASFDAGDGICTLCGGAWHCGEYGTYPPCPKDGVGTCDEDAAACFTCNLDDAAGSVCSCGGADGGLSSGDGGLAWSCMSSETACHN